MSASLWCQYSCQPDEAKTAFRPSVAATYTDDGYLRDAYR
jgi:hypothetical protein